MNHDDSTTTFHLVLPSHAHLETGDRQVSVDIHSSESGLFSVDVFQLPVLHAHLLPVQVVSSSVFPVVSVGFCCFRAFDK